jgi:integrase/recombinase XerD
MKITNAINQFRDYLTIERAYSPQTITAYSRDLHSFADYLHCQKQKTLVAEVEQADVIAFLAYLASTRGDKQPNIANTRARKLASIRSFFTFLRKRKVLLINPTDDIDIPVIPSKEPEYLSRDEYLKLLKVIRESASPFFKVRDILIVSLFLTCGLRVSELVGLRLSDVDLQHKTIKVHRKRNKFQTLPLTNELADIFEHYFAIRPSAQTESVFISKKHQGIRANSVFLMVRKYLRMAGIHKSRSCHLLRHTCFSSLLANGVNLFVIKELASHVNINTTQRYLHLNNTQIREAIQTINLKGDL